MFNCCHYVVFWFYTKIPFQREVIWLYWKLFSMWLIFAHPNRDKSGIKGNVYCSGMFNCFHYFIFWFYMKFPFQRGVTWPYLKKFSIGSIFRHPDLGKSGIIENFYCSEMATQVFLERSEVLYQKNLEWSLYINFFTGPCAVAYPIAWTSYHFSNAKWNQHIA